MRQFILRRGNHHDRPDAKGSRVRIRIDQHGPACKSPNLPKEPINTHCIGLEACEKWNVESTSWVSGMIHIVTFPGRGKSSRTTRPVGNSQAVQTYQNGFCPIANLVPITDTGMVETNVAEKTTGTCTKAINIEFALL